jgi:dienelactone hydrolase
MQRENGSLRAGLFVGTLLLAMQAHAVVKVEKVEYKQGETVLEGQLVFDDAQKGKRPGVVVVHDWMGPTAFTEDTAKDLAQLGYVAFVADIYGKGVRPKSSKEAGELAGKLKGDRPLMRARANAALEQLSKSARVDATKVAAIGFCFGGTTALELARAGAPLLGVVSFHGGLDTPKPEDAKNIKAKVLALHGADDPYVKPEEVAGFEREMTAAKVDWTLTKYSGAVHAFMVKDAGNDPSKGAAYNERVAKRAWVAMKDFFVDVFGATKG